MTGAIGLVRLDVDLFLKLLVSMRFVGSVSLDVN